MEGHRFPGSAAATINQNNRKFSKRLRYKQPGEIIEVETSASVTDVTYEETAAFLRSVGTGSLPGSSSDTQICASGSQGPPQGSAPELSSEAVPLAAYLPPALPTRASTIEAPGEANTELITDPGEERWFLGLGSKVVGVQHYNGIVSDREGIVLQRQPSNPYDRNAVQVLNMRGDQIGHIPREMASVLAPVMDRLAQSTSGRDAFRIEGHIPRGSGNVFSMPLRLAVFGHDPDGTVAPQLRNLGQRLRSTYCAAARGGVEVFSSPDASGTPVSDMDESTWKQVYGKSYIKKGAAGPSIQEVIERELEGIFRDGTPYSEMPEAADPPGLRAALYPHQRKALQWMVKQERCLNIDQALAEAASVDDSASNMQTPPWPKRRKASATMSSRPQVFFWTKDQLPNGGYVFKNLATNSAFREAPRLSRGGILADDMGLGKTITMIALILSSLQSEGRDQESARSAARASNLIVCPLSVLSNWMEQFRMHAPSLRVQVYHGATRDRKPSALARHDVILTTYEVIRAEAKDKTHGVASICWCRIVLDEAHVIKNHRTATAKALCDMRTEKRWCLTGTPIQNSVEDLFALARFLRLEPFDRFEWFNRAILRPLKSQDIVGFERLQVLLRMWCLRRTKDMEVIDCRTGKLRPLLMLPKKSIEVLRVPLDPGDQALYDKLFSLARSRVQQLEDASKLGTQFSQILQLLTRLRQLSCSTCLLSDAILTELKTGSGERALQVAVAELGKQKVEDLLKHLEEAQEDDCSICMEHGCDVVTRCGHPFHRSCIETAFKELGRAGVVDCPLCRQPIKQSELLEKIQNLVAHEGDEEAGSTPCNGDAGAKVRAVVKFLVDHVCGKKDRFCNKPHKAIVFSQFTSLLALIRKEIEKHNLAFVYLDGSLGHEKRVQALDTFRSHGHVQIFLCSLKAAGTGLNLTAADHVLLIDPWWNPSVEDQAIDRAHRLGQQRPVRAVRFVSERTVEERILTVHEQKRAIMDGALSQRSREELRRLRLNLVSSLFDPF